MEPESKKRKLDEDGAELSSFKDDLKKLAEPLSKEQLIQLLVYAGSQYSAVAEEIRDVASKDPAHRKLFVRGLAWETTSQMLLDVFSQFGEIEEGAVIIEKASGKSRGFGFITYKHMDSAQRALKEPSKAIDGRLTVCNLATSGTMGPSPSSSDISQRKLYIGGLSFETTSETLLNHFLQYGEIEEGSVAYDKNSNKSRGFGFVTFKSGEAARKAIEDTNNKTIEGRHVTVKLALDGQKEKPGGAQVIVTQGYGFTPAQHHIAFGGAAVNPNLATTTYPRPQLASAAHTTVGGPGGLGLSAYSPGLGFTTPPTSSYAGLTASSYGTLLPGTSQKYSPYGFP